MGSIDISYCPETLEKDVDEDIAEFEKWFCKNVDTSVPTLSHIERSIIKTYLWYKTHPENTNETGGSRT